MSIHGKSTVIGRLLADTRSLPEGKLEQVKENCKRNARPFECAFLLDALKDEQSQGITIDSARVFFKIESALNIARETVSKYTSGRIEAELKAGGDPVTEADLELDKVLRAELVRDDDGWLSEETVDDLSRLNKRRVWIVDPIDGTREFVEGIDEWCISVGLAVDGQMVAGGILNPARDELFLGAMEAGVTLNGKPVRVTDKAELEGATVLASRSEVKRGEWDEFMDVPLKVIPMGSVAYKLARVAAGLDDATFTLVPKNEWDYAAGTMLVEAAGGKTIGKDGETLTFNHSKTLISGLVATNLKLFDKLKDLLEIWQKTEKVQKN